MFLGFFQCAVLEEPPFFLFVWCVCVLAVGMVWGGLLVGWIGGDAGVRRMGSSSDRPVRSRRAVGHLQPGTALFR